MKNKINEMKSFVLMESRAVRNYFQIYWCQNFSKQAYLKHRSHYHENLWKF